MARGPPVEPRSFKQYVTRTYSIFEHVIASSLCLLKEQVTSVIMSVNYGRGRLASRYTEQLRLADDCYD